MQEQLSESRIHYDNFLAHRYVWMAGGWDSNLKKNRELFTRLGISPQGSSVAIDLGAGCGFQAIPLAEAGFRVTAVDFCRPLLAELHKRAGILPVNTVAADLLDRSAWTGRSPELITCMGDTLTHMNTLADVAGLIRNFHLELVPGGKLILSFRDYSRELPGSVIVIPVHRDPELIFLCRLEYEQDIVRVTDILFSRETGGWVRTASSYTKIRIAPEDLARELVRDGFSIPVFETGAGLITAVARKQIQENADSHGEFLQEPEIPHDCRCCYGNGSGNENTS